MVSGISGGSLLAAMWAYGPTTFEEFDDNVTTLLRHGLQGEVIRRALSPRYLAKGTIGAAHALAGFSGRRSRFARTEALVQALLARPFGSRSIYEVTHPNVDTVLSATDLTTTNAVRFGSAYTFGNNQAERHTHTVNMTDGGVYDNLGLSPLLPGRGPEFTSHVYDLDYVIAVDAGRGRTVKLGTWFWPRRLARILDITYNKSQDAKRTRLNAAAEHGQLRGFFMPTWQCKTTACRSQ